MPTGYEIQIGFVGPNAIYDAVDALKLDVLDYGESEPTTTQALKTKPFDLFEFSDESNARIEGALTEAYKAVAARLGWTFVREDDERYMIYDTPYGRRQTPGFLFGLEYDEDEVCDEPEDATLGIGLSSRYFPAVLDMESAHGTLRTASGLEEMMPVIAICREEIVKRLPAFAEAKVYIREIFY